MVVTTDLVEAFLKCPTKCFLWSRAEVASGNAYADWVRTKSEIFRTEGIRRLTAEAPLDRRAAGTAVTESGRSAQWQLALDFTARSENLQCSCYAVQRLQSAGQGRAAQFVPIRFRVQHARMPNPDFLPDPDSLRNAGASAGARDDSMNANWIGNLCIMMNLPQQRGRLTQR